MPELKVGDVAPAFAVKAHTGETITLSSYLGKRVLLWFYPMADTPG
jgi:peroxiredoxin Q/BCP